MESKTKWRWLALAVFLAMASGVSWWVLGWMAGPPADGSATPRTPDEGLADRTRVVSATDAESRRDPVARKELVPSDQDLLPDAGEDEGPILDRSGTRRGGGELLPAAGHFGAASEIAFDPRYNPGGVVLSKERRAELGELLSSLERGYQDVMVPLRKARDAEIQARIASGNYDRLPDQGRVRYRGARGSVGYVEKSATLGRIGIQFHPRDVPALAEAYANREAFLEEAEHLLRAFFY